MAKVKLTQAIPTLAYFIGDTLEMSEADVKKYADKVELLKEEVKKAAPKK
ncbi:hypothetical protein [Yeosuana sp.]